MPIFSKSVDSNNVKPKSEGWLVGWDLMALSTQDFGYITPLHTYIQIYTAPTQQQQRPFNGL